MLDGENNLNQPGSCNHSCDLSSGGHAMLLIVYYIAIMLILNIATVLIGFAVESLWGSVASLVVFLSLYFSTLWASWKISVWLTQPKISPAPAPAAVVV
jgi:hypothetical protein